MTHILNQKNNNESQPQSKIHVGPQINADDVENLTVYNYACFDCSKESSLIRIISRTFGFASELCQKIICASSRKAKILNVIFLSLLLIAVAGGITGKIDILT